jgi:hypothetical protein
MAQDRMYSQIIYRWLRVVLRTAIETPRVVKRWLKGFSNETGKERNNQEVYHFM